MNKIICNIEFNLIYFILNDILFKSDIINKKTIELKIK